MSKCAGIVLLALLGWGRMAAAEKLPVDTFSRQFTYDTIEISPGGTRLAVSYLHDDTEMLAVIDLASSKVSVVSSLKWPDRLVSTRWKSEDRLIYQIFAHDGPQARFLVHFAVNADGSHRVPLNFNWQRNGRLPSERVIDVNWEDPHSILIASDAADDEDPVVYRADFERSLNTSMVNARGGPEWPTRRQALFARPPGHGCRYMTDNAGVVRTCVTDEPANVGRLLYRPADGAAWVELERIAFGDSLQPVGFTPDNKQLYVISNIGRNTRALFVYDPQRREFGERLFEAPGVDVGTPVRGGDGRTLIGVVFNDKSSGIYYLDPQVAAIHQSLNNAFPGMQVRLDSFSRDNSRIVVWVGDMATPGAFHLYDRDKGSVRLLTDIAPWMVREKMAISRAIAFDARDGVHIHGYLTLPRDVPSKDLPLIVNVHGGPHGVRDTAEFDRETQLFANRGYAVLQINFRGSGGYGREFFNAGKHEWGRKMQMDLEDGVKWLVARGTVDANRVGIFGGSYGGYATMMAMINAPDMFKCGVTYAGVSNLVRMLNSGTAWVRNGSWGRNISKDERMWWESVIGDRHEEEALKAISPVFNVDRIRGPVLIAHGNEDLIVPPVQAMELYQARLSAGKPVEMMIVSNEGHGFFEEKNRKAFYERMDAFFAKNLPTG